MDRRNFFKKSSIAVSAIALTGLASGSINKLFAEKKMKKNSRFDHLSLEIITDEPEKALKLAKYFFSNFAPLHYTLKYSEYTMKGQMTGDIVYMNYGMLRNYRAKENKGNGLSMQVKSIADQLELPKLVINPTRMKFHSFEENTQADNFVIYYKNDIVKTIRSDSDNFSYSFKGTKGDVIINLDNGKLRVTQSSCTHQTCVNSGSISHVGENIACIPNELFIVGD